MCERENRERESMTVKYQSAGVSYVVWGVIQ